MKSKSITYFQNYPYLCFLFLLYSKTIIFFFPFYSFCSFYCFSFPLSSHFPLPFSPHPPIPFLAYPKCCPSSSSVSPSTLSSLPSLPPFLLNPNTSHIPLTLTLPNLIFISTPSFLFSFAHVYIFS